MTEHFYETQGSITDPGELGDLFDGLSAGVENLVRVVQGTIIHRDWTGLYGLTLSDERKQDVELRYVSKMLGRIRELDERPLMASRSYKERLVGTCRDFTSMTVAMLRHKGVPARARCGFGAYFSPESLEDHWVVEYWNSDKSSWQLVDAQIDALQRDALKLSFDPLNVPRDQFLVAGLAWRLCHSGQLDADQCGIFDLRGEWFVRGNVVRDFASLNKMEMLPWDAWGLADTGFAPDDELSAEESAILSGAAELSETGGSLTELRRLYDREARLRVPPVIRSFTATGPRKVAIPT